MQKVSYAGWPNCLRMANQEIELIVTTDVGPRIIRVGFIGGQNLFAEFPEDLGQWGGDQWRPYGGHRLWHAPEATPRSYAPDNGPVAYSWHDDVLTLMQSEEALTGISKEISLSLAEEQNRITVVHRLTNRNLWEITLAPWSISMMAPEGRAIFPQEPFVPHPTALLPARPLAVWPYTDMQDPRWTWGTRYIQIQQDPKRPDPQKIGFLNTQGWAAYALRGDLFLKRFAYDPALTYPDFGCNTESFVNDRMLEIESLGPLTRLCPGESVTHIEEWYLYNADFSLADEAAMAQVLSPILSRIQGQS